MTLPNSSNASTPPVNRKTKPWWVLWTLIWVAAVIVIWQFSVQGWDWRSLVENNTRGVIIFAVLMTILPIFGFPISAFYIYAGAVFDPWLIIPIGLVCLSINMSTGYLLAHYVWRAPLYEKFSARWPKIFAIDDMSAIRLTILIRAVPGIPFSIQNYLLGVLAVPFSVYITLSLFIQGCFLTGVVLTTRGALDKNGQVAFWGGLIIIFTLLGLRIFYRRRAMKT